MEPISPELALIDPDLRRAAIAQLSALPSIAAPAAVRPLGPAPTSAPSRSWLRRAGQVAALLGLTAAGVLVANVAARNTTAQPVLETVTAPAATTTAPLSSSVSGDPRSDVQRQLLQLIVQSPAGHLPKQLIDPHTGLAVNNLQAVCHVRPPGYLCVVRPALHKPGEGLYVQYGRNGFTWSRYRPGTG